MSEIKAEYFYIVVRDDRGQLITYNKYPEEDIDAQRVATTADIYDSAKQIVNEVEQNDFAVRVADLVMAQIRPKTPPLSEKMREALKERGIDTESIKPEQ